MKRFTPLVYQLLVPFFIFAGSPGGVDGIKMWTEVKPETFNLLNEYRMQDYSGNCIEFKQKQNTESADFSSKEIKFINYRPAVLIGGVNSIQANIPKVNLAQFTVLGVWTLPDNSINTPLANITDSHNASAQILKNNDASNSLFVQTTYHSGAPKYSAWGNVPRPSVFSFNTDGTKYCAELLVYGRILSPYERRQAESFLAMKYGIALKDAYYVGDTMLWDAKEGSYSNVAAIGCDSPRAFCQRKSISLYTGGKIPFSTYAGNNPYGAVSDSVLLSIGYGKGCLTPEGHYIMWGTKTGSQNAVKHVSLPIKFDTRTWKSRATSCVSDQLAARGFSNDSIGFIKLDGNKYGLVQKLPDKKCVFRPGESSDNRFFSFCQRYPSATFDVVFVSADNLRYGFRFNADNTISKITGDTVEKLATKFKHQNNSIEISREDSCIRLKINDTSDSTFYVPVQVQKMALEVVFEPNTNSAYGTELCDVRTGLHQYTGQRIELSKSVLNSRIFPQSRNTAIIINPNNDMFANNEDLISGRIYYVTDSTEKN